MNSIPALTSASISKDAAVVMAVSLKFDSQLSVIVNQALHISTTKNTRESVYTDLHYVVCAIKFTKKSVYKFPTQNTQNSLHKSSHR